MIEFLIVIAVIWLIVASYSDLKKREVPNWLNFSLVAFALAYRAFYSAFTYNWMFFVYGLLGFGFFFLLAYAFYYARIFAGGDAKLLMGLGAILPFTSYLITNSVIFGVFIFLLFAVGGVYGLIYSGVLVALNKKNFFKEFKKQLRLRKYFVVVGFVFALISLIFVLYEGEKILLLLSLIIFAFPFLLIYGKSAEEACMIKLVKAKDVTVGDWLYEQVKVGKRKIKPNWEGLGEEEVKLLKKSRKKVKIKYGVPFVPAFLIAFILLVVLWYSSWSFFQLF